MTGESIQDLSGLLAAWRGGDEEALKRFISIVYPELRRIARYHLKRREPNHSLESAALANEVYLKLIRAKGIQCESRVHFFALAPRLFAASL
jgi:DNA-directed RNA polymerase specialized sigma24 family protein